MRFSASADYTADNQQRPEAGEIGKILACVSGFAGSV